METNPLTLEILDSKDKKVCSINVSGTDVTIEEIKSLVSRTSGIPSSRLSIRAEPNGKDLDNNLSLQILERSIPRIYMKDLGPQVSWTLVFLSEYTGPLVLYPLVYWMPQLFYDERMRYHMSKRLPLVNFAFIMWSAHYLKRLWETLYVHRFSHSTMPLYNFFKNCGYYWGFTIYIAYHLNHPFYRAPSLLVRNLGLLIFIICEVGNLSVHLLLRDLRPPGTKHRGYPLANKNIFTHLFKYVSCPNYTYEVGSWLGFAIATQCLPALLFTLCGFIQMTIWAKAKRKRYMQEFPNYSKNIKAILPFVI